MSHSSGRGPFGSWRQNQSCRCLPCQWRRKRTGCIPFAPVARCVTLVGAAPTFAGFQMQIGHKRAKCRADNAQALRSSDSLGSLEHLNDRIAKLILHSASPSVSSQRTANVAASSNADAVVAERPCLDQGDCLRQCCRLRSRHDVGVEEKGDNPR